MSRYKLKPPGLYGNMIEPDLSLCVSCERAQECPDRTDDRKDIVKCVVVCEYYTNSNKLVRSADGYTEESEVNPNLCKKCACGDFCFMYRYIRCRENPVAGYSVCNRFIAID